MFITEKKTQSGRVYERQVIVTSVEEFNILYDLHDLRQTGKNCNPDLEVFITQEKQKSGSYLKIFVYVPNEIFDAL